MATHHGTFRLGNGKGVDRVGESYQDTMGFTVAGPDRFLGSGHPDVQGARQGQPARLGLVESTDAGVTWQRLSLSGEVDFHGLAFAHGRVYGWDATTGRFMVSTDRRSWDTRSTQPLAGFAVDPDDPDRVVGAGPQALLDSTDGGRTWRPLQGPWSRSPGRPPPDWSAPSAMEPSTALETEAPRGHAWGSFPGRPRPCSPPPRRGTRRRKTKAAPPGSTAPPTRDEPGICTTGIAHDDRSVALSGPDLVAVHWLALPGA